MQSMQTILSETNQKLVIQGELVSNLKIQVLNTQKMLEKKDNQLNSQKKRYYFSTKVIKKRKTKNQII
jgi:hypothetical protein